MTALVTPDLLHSLITDLRDELHTETWSAARLHFGTNGGRSTKGEPATDLGSLDPSPQSTMTFREVGWTGLPYTPSFERLLGSPDWWGTAYLARASIQEASDRCHARHMNHQRPGDRFGLCARLIFRVVELQQPIGHAAARLDLTEEGATNLLETMLTYMAQWRAERFRDLDRGTRVTADRSPQQQFLADHDDKDWEKQKWEGLKEAYHLPPWEIEWERRMRDHEREGCTRCARKAA